MKKIKLFFALFAMLALGVGNAWGETYELVTSISDLEAGAKYIVGNSASTSSIFMSTATNTNNRKVTSAITITDNKVTITEDVLILELGGETGAWTFKTTNYLGTQGFLTSAATGKNNYCKVVATAESCSYFTIAFSDQEATITSTGRNERNILRYNSTNGGLFACYSSGQSPVYLYKLTTSSGSGSTEPAASLTANPTSLDFGNVTQNNEVDAKTFTISGSDFTTGELTITAPSGYTVNPTTVPVNGTLEETTITVTPNTSTVGTFDGNVTISGANLKSSVNVVLSMTVEKAPATPTENVYVKVTSTAGITDGEYLIVYEDASNATPAPVAFDGSLATLDAVSNNIAVTITDGTIAGNTDIDAATFTIDATAKTIKSASGQYIGRTAYDNGLDSKIEVLTNTIEISEGNAVITASGNCVLRYNSASGQYRFRYYKSGQQPIALYKKASSHTVTIASCINGSVSADVASGATVLSGTTITLNNTPATGYKLAAYDVYKTGEESTKVTVTDGKFTMPEYDVTISATFELAKTLTGIEITTPATQTTFWQTETFNHDGLKVIAHFDGAADEDVTDKVTVTGSTATAGAAVEVTVSYNEGATTKTATYNITVKAIPNTKATAYTVADAFDIIDKLTTAEGVFISGIISQVDSYNSTYKSITYWISADGTTTNQLQAYSGKGLESADFAAVTDLSVGDQVIVCGDLKKHTDGTYEFNYNNYLVEHIKTTKADPELSYTTTEYNVNLGDEFTAPTLNNPHSLAVTYSSNDEDVATVAVDGAVTIKAAGTVTITASFAGDEDYVAGEASYTITITDLSLLIATLPFEFNGKQADIEGTAGMTHHDIDADDYKSAPYLKMNTTGDWLVIHFDSEPDQLSYDIKNNSFSGGTFSVQESADGETYTDVAVHTTIEGTQNEEYTLLSTSRYVKFIYTNKVNGNVGLGNITISKPDSRQDAGLAWNPTSVTLTQGEAFTAPTLNKPNSVSDITYESSNDEVATVTTAGVIALGSATGTATITASFAGDATYKPATATCTITVNEYIETIDGEWELVTDASKLQAGMEIIIASVEVDGKYYAMSKASDNGNNRTAVESTISGDKLNPAVGTTVLTLIDAGNGTFALQAGNGKYLYAASSSANLLKEKDEIDVNGQWTITIADNVATIKAEGSSNRNWIRYNSNSTIFSCYTSGQQDIALYAKVPEHSRSTSAGRYGTICLPGNIVKCLGATLYEVAGKDGNKVIFDEVLTPEAGMPYIFLAHNAEVLFYCGDQTDAAGNHNSLYGTFSVLQDAQLDGMYIVQNNKIVKCAATGCGVAENRAYFNGGELEALESAPAPMPGRRRITMGTESENTATGTEDVIAPEGQTLKLIENGQLIIIRDGVKYNVQGQKL